MSSELRWMTSVTLSSFLVRHCLCVCLCLCLCLSSGFYTSHGTEEKEKTLAMIKPDGVFGNHTDEIKKIIVESGFEILTTSEVRLDKDRAAAFYSEHSSKSFFPNLIEYMTSGPVFIMVLEKENAVADWRTLIGPTDSSKAKVTHPHSIRGMCGLDSEKNCVHGSDSPQSAAREISFFFQETSSDEVIMKHDEL